MLLIDEVINKSQKDFTVIVNLTKDYSFMTDKGVPSYVSIEMMAQSISAYNTHYFSKGQGTEIGFMIAIRNFKANIEYFPLGAILKIKVNPILILDQTGSFTAEVLMEGLAIVSSRITAYVPTKEELEQLRKDS